MASPIDLHKAGLAKFHDSEEFSDCKIICGSYHFNVHKIILSVQSEYFRAALKRSTFKEGESGIIELKAKNDSSDPDNSLDDPDIVRFMIEYFYHFDYLQGNAPVPKPTFVLPVASPVRRPAFIPPHTRAPRRPAAPPARTTTTSTTAPTGPRSIVPRGFALTHAKVFAMAVKYQVPGLSDLASKKFAKVIQTRWNDDHFAEVITFVHDSTPEQVTELRTIVNDTICDHVDDFQQKDAIEEAILGVPSLVFDLLKRVRGPKDQYTCTQGHSSYGKTEVQCQASMCSFVFFYCDVCRKNKTPVTCKRCGTWYR